VILLPKVLVDKKNLGFWGEFLVRREMDGYKLKGIVSSPHLLTLQTILVATMVKTE